MNRKTNDLKPHPINIDIYGSENVDRDLVESIRSKGILEPIVIKDNGIILSGHRRWLAAKELRLEEVPCRVIAFETDLDEKEALIEFNRQRIKTFEQKMKEADYLFGIESERAELRMLEGKKIINPPPKSGEGIYPVPTLAQGIKNGDKIPVPLTSGEQVGKVVPTLAPPKDEEKILIDPLIAVKPTLAERANEEKIPIIPSKQEIGQVRDIISEKIGMKHSTFDKARKVWDDFKSGKETAVEQVKKLNTNDTTINRALNEIKQSEQPLQPKILIPPPEGKFKTLIVDPPWEVKKIIRDVRPNQSTFDYQTMTIDEIKAIDLPAFDDAHIYLWTTQKYLPYAFDILKHWGFNYIFTMVWHKSGGFQPMGLPQYNCEFVLFGRRGSLPFTDTKAFNTCFNANRKEHSRKPDEFYDLVRRVSPEPRIDMFSREKRDGFAQWGNETEKFGVI